MKAILIMFPEGISDNALEELKGVIAEEAYDPDMGGPFFVTRDVAVELLHTANCPSYRDRSIFIKEPIEWVNEP